MGLKAAFNYMLAKHTRTGTLSRVSPAQSVAIKFTPTNYSRNLDGPANTVFKGREIIISKEIFDASGFTGPLKRGDRITDSEFGALNIREIDEMFDLGAQVIGYRCRCD